MFNIKNPSELNKAWLLSKNGNDTKDSIPLAVTKLLKNYHVMAIEFLYHNYRKGMKGSILNEEPDMNYPLQISAFLRAVVDNPNIVLVICPRETGCSWHYHLANEGNFEVVQVTTKNSDTYESNNRKVALIVYFDCLKLCEDLLNRDFFSVIIEDFDRIAIKRIVKRLEGKFNIGITCRSFYTDPDQKLQWNMLNWANPGCVGKLQDFYEIDNNNFENFEDNYRYWWLRLTWQFCDSFERPTQEELEIYNRNVSDWGSANSLNFQTEKRARKRKFIEPVEPIDEVISDSCSSDATVTYEVPSDKYVQLPSMDESPILSSIIRNLEASPEPILIPSQTRFASDEPNCSKYDENSVLFSFLDREAPCSSRSQSEEFIINLIKESNKEEIKAQDIDDILRKADAVLQN